MFGWFELGHTGCVGLFQMAGGSRCQTEQLSAYVDCLAECWNEQPAKRPDLTTLSQRFHSFRWSPFYGLNCDLSEFQYFLQWSIQLLNWLLLIDLFEFPGFIFIFWMTYFKFGSFFGTEFSSAFCCRSSQWNVVVHALSKVKTRLDDVLNADAEMTSLRRRLRRGEDLLAKYLPK